jgi:hypothetical protein
MGRVMHEFEHGELRSGRSGKGGKVTNRRQAIAIALKEAGASKYESERENRRNLAKTERKEARGETYQQEREGKSHFGARGHRESSRAMGRSQRHASYRTGQQSRAEPSAQRTQWCDKAAALQEGQGRHIPGRSRMTKRQLENALHSAF